MLNERILEYRKKMGLSQEKLGERIGVTRQTISNWELGETSPSLQQLKLLSQEFGVSIDNLLDNNVDKDSKINKLYSEKLARILIIYFKVSLIICIVIILGLLFYKTIHRPKKEAIGLIEKEESIYCKIYGEEHGYTIRYYAGSDLIIAQDGDTYFLDILDLGKYNYAHQIFNVINDYVKKNGGICEVIKDRDINDIVDMQIKEGTLSKTGLTIIINEKIDYNISYGEAFWVEKYNYKNSSFEKLENITGKNCAFNMPAYGVKPDRPLELYQDFTCMYGSLSKGLYRLVKDAFFESDIPVDEDDIFYVWVEFTIDD